MVFTTKIVCVLLIPTFIASLARYLYVRFFSRYSIPEVFPWAGVEDSGPWSRARATLHSFLHTKELLQDGYYKYSKKGIPFILPNILTGPEVILPMSQMDWLLQQPDNVLDQNEVNRQFLQADHTMLHPKVIRDTVHAEVIRRELTKMLGDFTGDVIDEIDFAFRKNWGVDTSEWNEVVAYETMSDIISRISNRVLVGVPLCRNEDYLDSSMKFARMVVVEAGCINMLPEFLKPILAPLITFSDYLLYKRCAKYIVPIVKQRTSAPIPDDKQKNDYVQWSLDHASAHQDPAEAGPDMISKRLAVISFAAIQSSAITLTNLIFDLAACPLTTTYLSTMRSEVLSELAAENGAWTKASLARMLSLDSALRESMRLWGFVSRGVLKMVVKKGGVTLPGGLHLPQGVKVGVHAHPVHHDYAIYPSASDFNAFRFCQTGDEQRPDSDYSETMAGTGKNRGTSLVTTSSNFMAFSHGRHACPGRFFASQQLKLVLAYIALNYDIQPIPFRPDNQWFVGSSGPPLGDKIFIRRRAGTEDNSI